LEWPITCYIAARLRNPKTWTLGPCRTLDTNLPDLWDSIHTSSVRRPQQTRWSFLEPRSMVNKPKKIASYLKSHQLCGVEYHPATIDEIFDQEVVPEIRPSSERTATLSKIIAGLHHRLGTEDATAAMCMISETQRRKMSGRACPMNSLHPDLLKRIEERRTLCRLLQTRLILRYVNRQRRAYIERTGRQR